MDYNDINPNEATDTLEIMRWLLKEVQDLRILVNDLRLKERNENG